MELFGRALYLVLPLLVDPIIVTSLFLKEKTSPLTFNILQYLSYAFPLVSP